MSEIGLKTGKCVQKKISHRKRKAKSCNETVSLELINYLESLNVDQHVVALQSEELKNIKKLIHFAPPAFGKKDLISVRIVHSNSPNEFFVIKTQSIEEYETFQYNLTAEYAKKSFQNIYIPQKGILCCAKINEKWFRAEIKSTKENETCKIFLIDVGSTNTVHWSCLKMINANVACVGKFIVQCSLIGTESAKPASNYTTKCLNEFNQICHSSKMKEEQFCIFVNSIQSNCCQVYLYKTTNSMHTCINNAIIKEQSDTEKEYESSEMDSYINPDTLYSEKEKVCLMHIESLDEFYVCLKKTEKDLHKFQTGIQNWVYNSCKDNNDCTMHLKWSPNDNCLVEKKFWFRGIIIDCISNRTFTVFLRDVGETIIVDITKLKPIDPKLCNVRNNIIKCKLVGIKPCVGKLQANEAFSNCAKSFDQIAISIHGKPEKSIISVILWGINVCSHALTRDRAEWSNINLMLVDSSVTEKDENFAAIDIGIKEINDTNFLNDLEYSLDILNIEIENDFYEYECAENENNQMYDVNMNLCKVIDWLPSEPIYQNEITCTVTYVSNKCVIYALDMYRKSIANKMETIINRKIAKSESILLDASEWKKGQPCFARFQNDKLYYRATISRVYLSQGYCVVRFVDYGSAGECKLKNLYKANMFGNVPILTRTYYLENIKPNSSNGLWEKNGIDFCGAYLIDAKCKIKISNRNDISSIQPCQIQTYESGCDLGTMLRKNGMAL